MKLTDKINMDYNGLVENGPITIVVFGDSVTHGALSLGEINYETVYWNRLKQKINAVRSYVPVNVINAGIGGITASGSIERMDRQVFVHDPDLIIICFGLNDVNGDLESYLDSMQKIFASCIEHDTEAIFMTPNMLNTYVADDTADEHKEYAAKTAQMQNSGKMDAFMEGAAALAEKMGITVCDCYAMWKELAKSEDTTMLLANRINHPTKEMHELFAKSLFDAIFKGSGIKAEQNESTMYKA